MSAFENKDASKKNQDQLGLDVKLESKELDNDLWAQNTLKEIGKAMPVLGHRYIGSAAIHYYISDLGREFATKHQFALGNLNESVASVGLQNFAIAMKKFFGRSHKTTNKKDLR